MCSKLHIELPFPDTIHWNCLRAISLGYAYGTRCFAGVALWLSSVVCVTNSVRDWLHVWTRTNGRIIRFVIISFNNFRFDSTPASSSIQWLTCEKNKHIRRSLRYTFAAKCNPRWTSWGLIPDIGSSADWATTSQFVSCTAGFWKFTLSN